MSEEVILIEDLIFHYSTIKCHVVSVEEDSFGMEADRIFLPKSEVERLTNEAKGDVFEVPEWLALEKGLI